MARDITPEEIATADAMIAPARPIPGDRPGVLYKTEVM